MTRDEIILNAPVDAVCEFIEDEEFDDALVGFQYLGNGFEVVYDDCKVVDILQRHRQLTRDEAWEVFDLEFARLPIQIAFKEALGDC